MTNEIILNFFISNFSYEGSYNIRNGKINIIGNVTYRINRANELPINFGIVTGSFLCDGKKLTSLKGFPEKCKHQVITNCINLKSWSGLGKDIDYLELTGSTFYPDDIKHLDNITGDILFDDDEDEMEYLQIRRSLILEELLNGD